MRIYKPELTFRAWDVYRAYYCGICKAIKRRYGEVARLTLSYDCVFFALLFDGFVDGNISQDLEITEFRCGYHPLQKRPIFKEYTSRVDYVADITVLLAFLKLKDDEYDDDGHRLFPRKLFSSRIEKKLIKNLKEWGKADLLDLGKLMIDRTIIAQRDYKPEESFEQVGGPFAEFFAEVFDIDSCEKADSLRQIGKVLGLFIYMLDAYDDRSKDVKSGAFNPFLVGSSKDENKRENLEIIGNLYLKNISELYAGLGLEKNTKILDNIIYIGLYSKMKEVLDE